MKFKYRVANYWSTEGWDVPGMQACTLVEGLDELGADGWELVLAIVTEPSAKGEETLTEYHFKQQI